LAAHRLRIKFHQAQYIFRHIAVYKQTELTRWLAGNSEHAQPKQIEVKVA
jgi:hypothetical protein